jgi:hypothetical protein
MAAAQETKIFRYSWKAAGSIMGGAAVAVGLLNIKWPSLTASLIILGVAAVFAGYFAWLALRVKLVIDATGVTFVETSETHSMTWDNIHSVACGPTAGRERVRTYTLYSHGSPVITFENEISDSERAFRTIERRISVQAYPRYHEALERGDIVEFGVIKLSKYNVTIRQLNIPVTDARFVREGHSLTLLRRTTAEAVVSVDEGEVQNINILLRCAAELDPHLVGNPRSFRAA